MRVYQCLFFLEVISTLTTVIAFCGGERNIFHQQRTCVVTTRMFATSVIDEPEGGVELTPYKAMEGVRMKNMGRAEDVSGKDGPAYNIWLTAQVDGKLISEFRAQISKDASKKANFPGFRKGQVPPWAQPKMTAFALQEGIVKTAENVVAAFGVKALDGSAGNMDMKEDIKDILKGYKAGDDVTFTATVKCEFDPTKQQATVVEAASVAVIEENNDTVTVEVVAEELEATSAAQTEENESATINVAPVGEEATEESFDTAPAEVIVE